MPSAFGALAQATAQAGAADAPAAPPQWEDVTGALREACAALGVGGIVKRDGFTLQDSMNALELMSPKMDFGLRPESFRSVRERVAEGSVALPPPSARALVHVLDVVLNLELAYFNGHSLAMTVHACVYLSQDGLELLRERVEALLLPIGAAAAAASAQAAADAAAAGDGGGGGGGGGGPAAAAPQAEATSFAEAAATSPHRLRPDWLALAQDTPGRALALATLALALAVVKGCGLVRQHVRAADIYEEEDFSTSQLGLPLAEETPVEDVLSLLGAAEELVRAGGEGDASASALVEVLRWRADWLRVLVELERPELAGVPAALALVDQLQERFARAGGPAAASRLPAASAGELEQARCCVVPDINRKVLASSPPRAGPVIDGALAHAGFLKLLGGLRRVCLLESTSPSLLALWTNLQRLSAGEPCILVRSLVVPMLYAERSKLALGRYRYEEWLLESFREFGMSREEAGSQAARGFAEAMVKPAYELLRLLTANRARQRRNIANMLPEWSVVQQEAEAQDQSVLFETRPELDPKELESWSPAQLREVLFFTLHGWAVEWTLRLMLHHLLLGFELELYAPHERDAMYWYLAYLQGKLRENRQDVEHFVELKTGRLAVAGKSLGGAARARADKELAELRAQQKATRENALLNHERVLGELYKLLAEGVLRVLLAMRMRGNFPKPCLEFASDRIRYNHRLAPYAVVAQPIMLTYDNYCAVTDLTKLDSSVLLEHAKAFFERAKIISATLIKNQLVADDAVTAALLKQLLKTAVGNSVTIVKALQDGAGAPGSLTMDYSVAKPAPAGAQPAPATLPGRAHFPVLAVQAAAGHASSS